MGTMTTAVSVGKDGQVRMYLLWGVGSRVSEVFLAYPRLFKEPISNSGLPNSLFTYFGVGRHKFYGWLGK